MRRSIPVFFALLLTVTGTGWAQDAEGLYQAGRRAFQDGLFPMAGRSFQTLVDQYPDHALADDAEYLLGLAEFYGGDYRRSIAVLSGFPRRYPRSPNLSRVSYWLGAACYHLGSDGEALAHFDRQVADYPQEAFYSDHALLLRALAMERLGRWDEAQQGLRQVLARASAADFHAEALFRLGGLELRQEEFAGAFSSFSRLIVEFPGSPQAAEAGFFAAEAAFFAGRDAEAERRYRRVLAGPPPPVAEQQQSALYRLALIRSRNGGQAEALELCRELERRFPAGAYARLLPALQADLLFDLGRFAEAADAYRQALALAEGPAQRQGIAYNLAVAAEAAGSPAQAVEALREASAGGGAAAERSLFRLGTLLAAAGRDQEAQRALLDFEARFPASERREQALRQLAFVYRRSGQAAAADKLYSRLLAHYPGSSGRDEYLFGRANARLAAGDALGGMKDFFALVEQHPDSTLAAESRYHLGYLYSQRGEYKRAMEQFAAALAPSGQSAPAELRARTILAAGVCAFNAGDYPEAARWFEQNLAGAAGAGPWAAESRLYLGRTYYKLGRLEEAARSFGAAAASLEDPAHAEEGLFWQGLCEFRLDRLRQAEATFLEVARRFPAGLRKAESLYRAGLCAAQEKRHAESIGHYDRALRALGTARAANGDREYLANLEQEILYQKGWSAFRSGDRPGAEQSFAALAAAYPGGTLAPEAYFKLAEEDLRAGQAARALQGFLSVRERFPSSDAAASALYWAGVCQGRLDRGGEALESLLGYLELEGAGRGQPALRELALTEMRSLLEQLVEAGPERGLIEAFYRRAESSPALPGELKQRVSFEYARALFEVDAEAALPLLERLGAAGVQGPLRGQIAYLTGEHYRRTGALPRAREIFTGLVGSSSGESGALAQLGLARILEAENRRLEAAEEYLKVYFLYPDHRGPAEEGLFQSGRLYWQMGDRGKARELFEKLAAESPGSPWLAERPDR